MTGNCRKTGFPIWLAALFILAGSGAAAAIETSAKLAFMIDVATDTVLFEKNADQSMPPASMSKLMTAYMVFERLANGNLKLDDSLPVSENAWRKGGSKMFVKVGDRVSIEDLLRGIIVQSGNDACIVVAEGLSGSESAFADAMTRRAREIGLQRSTFRNATGWPDPQHVMTPRDLAVLAKRIIQDFPQYYHYYSEKTFTYAGIRQGNRNPLLYRNMGADGLKTGHTEASGYGLTASAKRGDRRIILVLNGRESVRPRSQEATRLLEWGFREFDNLSLFKAGETVTDADVWLGIAPTVPLVVEQDVVVTLSQAARRTMLVSVVYDGPIPAPIRQGTPLARVRIASADTETIEVPLVAGAGVERLGFFGRLASAAGYLLWGAAAAIKP